MEKLKFERGADRQNDIVRPAPNTKTGHVWHCIELLRARKNGFMPTKAELWGVYSATLADANKVTCNTQYHRYKQYHGLQAIELQIMSARHALKKINRQRGEILNGILKEKRKK